MLERPAYAPPDVGLPEVDDLTRAIVARVNHRRLALMSDQQLMRARYEEVMRWANPPWDPISRRLDPRADTATAERVGQNILHVDLTNAALDRWAVLQLGAPIIFRVKPTYVRPPVDNPSNPQASGLDRQNFDFDTAMAQAHASQMENQTQEWVEANSLDRTLLWAAWAKEAFGKAIIKTGWDPIEQIPTAELYENPSTVYYGWTKRYGNRKIAWAMVVDEIDPGEANRRFGINLPEDEQGNIDFATWTGLIDQGDMDQRPEQLGAIQKFVGVQETWELANHPLTDAPGVLFALILAGRVIEGPTWYPWKRVPFHILENQHMPTWAHGKSLGEVVIPLNAALDDTLDREHQVIEFESGPRYKGLNMANSGDEVDIPPPFHMVPLREGEDIGQIETRVDFFPAETHLRSLYDGIYHGTGLTPIAWGMSPNAQTSGRAMSAEWRAVELPLTGKLVTMTPDIKSIFLSWWDYAETYNSDVKKVGKGYRRFEILWLPLDIRDKTEKNADIINRLNANIIDPETAIQESGYENVDEIRAKIQSYLTNPIWNPLRYQQLLTLQQLELSIRQQQLQVQQMEAQAAQSGQGAQPGAPGPGGPPGAQALAQQGATAAGAQAQGTPTGSVSQNQPGQQPGAGLLPVNTSILSQTPLVGGIGNRAIVDPAGGSAPGPTPSTAGPAPTSGVAPR